MRRSERSSSAPAVRSTQAQAVTAFSAQRMMAQVGGRWGSPGNLSGRSLSIRQAIFLRERIRTGFICQPVVTQRGIKSDHWLSLSGLSSFYREVRFSLELRGGCTAPRITADVGVQSACRRPRCDRSFVQRMDLFLPADLAMGCTGPSTPRMRRFKSTAASRHPIRSLFRTQRPLRSS